MGSQTIMRALPRCPPLRRERGQALIYGLFVLTAGLAALYFLFNTGQLVAEKSKLVNTADAVAYSAGVMHARALNFDAYTNRALIANEVLIAQAVSIAAWTRHVMLHAENVPALGCYSQYAVPIALRLVDYTPLCFALSMGQVGQGAEGASQSVHIIAQETVRASEAAKAILQGAQKSMAAAFIPARARLMQQVADANYAGEGAVRVDPLPLTDDYLLFEGQPFVESRSGDQRARFKEVAVRAAYQDGFVERRSWSDRSQPDVACMLAPGAEFKRRGATAMVGLDEWRAVDTASLHSWRPSWGFWGPRCRDNPELALGYGAQHASKDASGQGDANLGDVRDNPVALSLAEADPDIWRYSGLPGFADLSAPALARLDPRLKFAVLLTRAKADVRTSDGASTIRPGGRLAIYRDKLASARLSAIGTSEVFFQRPQARADGKSELASLFNPYWQVHLISTSALDVAAAMLH
jgi:hypothetical protein